MYRSALIALTSGTAFVQLDGVVAPSDTPGGPGDTYVVNATLMSGATNPGFLTANVVKLRLHSAPWSISFNCVDASGEPVTACNDIVQYSYDDGVSPEAE